LLLVALPVGIVTTLIYGIVPPASAGHFVLFVGFAFLSVLIVFTIGIIFALLSFWVLDAHALEWFMRGLMVVLSGGIVPIWFFPPWLAVLAQSTPFAFVTYYPMAAYLGRFSLMDTVLVFLGGLAWAVVLAAVIFGLWASLTRRLTVMGG